MLRKQVYLHAEQLNFLESLPGSLAEHVRIAVDDYIEKKKNLNVSSSQSKKGGE
jgi:hypothetical protein